MMLLEHQLLMVHQIHQLILNPGDSVFLGATFAPANWCLYY